MNSKILHTPEGVRDIYNEECQRKITLAAKVNEVISSYGFLPIQTPTFEFFDIFGKEVGTTSSKDLYKFFDREGNTLVLRPDVTPSIARAAAKYYTEDIRPIRLSYEANVFANNSSYQGRLKETTQIGGELIGDSSVDSDAEVIALVVEVLLKAGLKTFQISIGHADIFTALMDAAEFTDDEKEEIRNLISNKNVFGVEEFLDQKQICGDLRTLFTLVCKMYPSPDDWKDIKDASYNYPKVQAALDYLTSLNELLKIYDVEKYVSFELGLLSEYKYYTGIIFSGYTYGSGEPIVKGGRYDSLMEYFGKQSPAIGFAFTMDQLMIALERSKIKIDTDTTRNIIIYTPDNHIKAIELAKEKRMSGMRIELVPFSGTDEELNSFVKLYHKHNVTVL